MWYETGKPQGLLMSVLFFMLYFTAMRGTFTWHKEYKDVPPGLSHEMTS